MRCVPPHANEVQRDEKDFKLNNIYLTQVSALGVRLQPKENCNNAGRFVCFFICLFICLSLFVCLVQLKNEIGNNVNYICIVAIQNCFRSRRMRRSHASRDSMFKISQQSPRFSYKFVIWYTFLADAHIFSFLFKLKENNINFHNPNKMKRNALLLT